MLYDTKRGAVKHQHAKYEPNENEDEMDVQPYKKRNNRNEVVCNKLKASLCHIPRAVIVIFFSFLL